MRLTLKSLANLRPDIKFSLPRVNAEWPDLTGL